MRIQELYEAEDDVEDNAEDGDVTPVYSDTANVRANVFPKLQEKIDKLNKRAAKLSVPPITLTKVREFMQPMDKNPNVKEKFFEVKIEGQPPKIEGYKFIATIQHTEGGNVIRTVPGYNSDSRIKQFYEAHPDYCDQCKKKRYRIDTFIVQDDQGNLRQIGRNCLKDFLGGRDPKSILWYFSLRTNVAKAIAGANRTVHKGIGIPGYLDVKDVLGVGAAVIRQYGYVPGTDKATGERNENSTATRVRGTVFSTFHADREFTPTEDDQKMVEKIMNWWNSVPAQEKDRNEFMHNLDVLIKNQHVTGRDIGYVVALFPMYNRFEKSQQQTQTTQQTKSNEFVGTPGTKIPPTHVKVIRKHSFPTQYGMTEIINMEDDKGNVLVWFSGSAHLDLDKDYTITGTVKKLSEFKGRKQTELTRVKVLP